MCVEYSGTGAVITSSPRVPGRVMITNIGLAPAPPRFSGVENHNIPSNAGIDFDQSAHRSSATDAVGKNLLICIKADLFERVHINKAKGKGERS
jgi:hypothetical protein